MSKGEGKRNETRGGEERRALDRTIIKRCACVCGGRGGGGMKAISNTHLDLWLYFLMSMRPLLQECDWTLRGAQAQISQIQSLQSSAA